LHHGHERCLNQHDEHRLLASVRAIQDHAESRRFDSRIILVSLDSQPHCDFRGAQSRHGIVALPFVVHCDSAPSVDGALAPASNRQRAYA
jgi:hypothetical protein